MKLLVIRFSSIGDIVLTSPVLAALKKRHPEAEIHYLTKKAFQEILIHNPNVDKLWLLEDNLGHLLKRLKLERFDWVVDLHRSLRSRWVCWALQRKTLTFSKENWKKWRMVNLKTREHVSSVVSRYFEAVKELGVGMESTTLLEYYPGAEAEQEAQRLLEESGFGNDYIAIVLSATHFTKKWPEAYFLKLLQQLDRKVVLLGGKSEIQTGNWLEQQIHSPDKVLNLCGKTSLNVSAVWLKNSQLVVSHDTGLMHIACAFQKKLVVLWGNTDPSLGFGPFHNPNAVNLSVSLPCKPCSKLGRNQCPQKHFHCMRLITPEQVLETIHKLIKT